MTPQERKAAFRQKVDLAGMTLGVAAQEVCGVNWIHLSEGIKNNRPLSDDVKQKFSDFIEVPVEKVFGAPAPVDSGDDVVAA